jgi:hypothetical protein
VGQFVVEAAAGELLSNRQARRGRGDGKLNFPPHVDESVGKSGLGVPW